MQEKEKIESNNHLRQNPFAVPNGYFEQLEARLKQIPAQEPKGRVIGLNKIWIRTLAAAASIALMVTLAWLNWPNTADTSITGDDIIALTESGYLPYTELTFLDVIDEADLDQVAFESDDLSEYYEYTQPDLIEDYYLITDDI